MMMLVIVKSITGVIMVHVCVTHTASVLTWSSTPVLVAAVYLPVLHRSRSHAATLPASASLELRANLERRDTRRVGSGTCIKICGWFSR